MFRFTLTAACTVSAVTLAACGGAGATGPPGISAGTTDSLVTTVDNIQVTPSSTILTALGAVQRFTAVAKDADGTTVLGKTFTWASSDTNVATIDASSGIATAVTNGSTSITATTDGVSGTASLTVQATQ